VAWRRCSVSLVARGGDLDLLHRLPEARWLEPTLQPPAWVLMRLVRLVRLAPARSAPARARGQQTTRRRQGKGQGGQGRRCGPRGELIA
jgi:hypothetical protein